jgi:hypothetical protein
LWMYGGTPALLTFDGPGGAGGGAAAGAASPLLERETLRMDNVAHLQKVLKALRGVVRASVPRCHLLYCTGCDAGLFPIRQAALGGVKGKDNNGRGREVVQELIEVWVAGRRDRAGCQSRWILKPNMSDES